MKRTRDKRYEGAKPTGRTTLADGRGVSKACYLQRRKRGICASSRRLFVEMQPPRRTV